MSSDPRPAARRETLLPGGRPIDPRRFYLGYRGLANFLNAVAASTYGLYVVREAGLDPLQLLLVGTALELSAFAFEVPTGVIADVYSRRLSILIGVFVTGLSWIVMAAVPGFLFVALGQVILGLGFTFRSGALEAWLADEIGEERAAGTYLRGAQFSQFGFLLGIPVGVFAATVDLQAPMLAGGAAHLLLALAVALTMSERGFLGSETTGWSAVGNTALAGVRAVRGRPVLVAIVAIAVIAIDLATKWWVLDVFQQGPSIREVAPFFNVVLVLNRGVSFGLLPIDAAWGPWLFAGIATVVVALLIVWLVRADRRLLALGIGLVIGGAVGNVVDRIRYGGVVDFLDFHLGTYHWPAFNAADSAIVLGVAVLLYTSLFAERDPP